MRVTSCDFFLRHVQGRTGDTEDKIDTRRSNLSFVTLFYSHCVFFFHQSLIFFFLDRPTMSYWH